MRNPQLPCRQSHKGQGSRSQIRHDKKGTLIANLNDEAVPWPMVEALRRRLTFRSESGGVTRHHIAVPRDCEDMVVAALTRLL